MGDILLDTPYTVSVKNMLQLIKIIPLAKQLYTGICYLI